MHLFGNEGPTLVAEALLHGSRCKLRIILEGQMGDRELKEPNIQRSWGRVSRPMWIKSAYGSDGILVVLPRTGRHGEGREADWGSEGSDSEKNTGRNNSSAARVEEVSPRSWNFHVHTDDRQVLREGARDRNDRIR